MPEPAFAGIRVCDFSGQLAGAGATRFFAAMGAEVIRIEDPVTEGYWDALRGVAPFVDDRRGRDLGGPFNNHNVEKLGVTLNLRTDAAKELLRELVAISDVVTENFSAGVLARLGFSYEELTAIKPDIIYVSNSGFGHVGPYRAFKTWGPLVQACCGLAHATGLAGQPPAGIGYSYMDHHGASFMAIAVLAGLLHRHRTGEGQWIDVSCTDAGALLNGPAVLDYTVNGRRTSPESNDSNHSCSPAMAPHGIYRAAGDDNWIAIACRDDRDWKGVVHVVGEEWVAADQFATLDGRLTAEAELDRMLDGWTSARDRFAVAALLRDAGVPATAVQRPGERIEDDPGTAGLWPTVTHALMGEVRVDGLPLHFSETDWGIGRGAPCLGQHNDVVFGDLLGHPPEQIARWRTEGVL